MSISNNITPLKVIYGSKSSNISSLPVSDGNLILKEEENSKKFKLYADNSTRKELAVEDVNVNWEKSDNSNYTAGTMFPIASAMSNLHSANRFAFASTAGITIEISNDGGSTWTNNSSWDDTVKTQLVSGIGVSLGIGGKSSGKATVNDKLRITLDATKMNVYTALTYVLLNIDTSGASGSNVKIEYSNKGSSTTFKDYGTYPLRGWSGWNVISFGNWAFGGSNSQTSQIAVLRFTFGITGVSSRYNSILSVFDILGFGTTYWSFNSTMAKTGHLYNYDANQNATFPRSISTGSDLFYESNNSYALNLHNSDVVNINGLYFADSADSFSEGLNFINDNGKYDTLRAYNGNLYFSPQRSKSTTNSAPSDLKTYTIMGASGKLYSQGKAVLTEGDSVNSKWEVY